MNKYLPLSLILILVLLFSACTGADKTTEAPETEPVETTAAPTTPAPETEAPTEPHIPPETVETTEEPDEKAMVLGAWYGLLPGAYFKLELTEDLKYTVTFLGGDGEDLTGTWSYEDGRITLDNEDHPSFYADEEVLYWPDADVLLSREEPELYTPQELVTELPEGAFDGYWKSVYVDLDGLIVPSELVGDETDLFIKESRAALGGPLFGDVILDLEKADCALIAKGGEGEDAVAVRIELQEDHLLRMTLEFEEDDLLVIYMALENTSGE